MADNKKDNMMVELAKLTDDYLAKAKAILEKNDFVYMPEKKSIGSIPFDGVMPTINNDMLEDLFLDIINNRDCIKYCLHEKSYVEQKIAEYENYMSPKNRILRHMSEIERLKDKYHVTDEDLKK